MSKKEESRRQLASRVMKKAWEFYKRGLKWAYSWSICLKLAWQIIKGKCNFKTSNVKGVNYSNENGVKRQEVLKRLMNYPAEFITLYCEREPNNKFDSNAIKVIAKVADLGSCQVGYMAKNITVDLAMYMDFGKDPIIVLESITRSCNGLLSLTYNYAI